MERSTKLEEVTQSDRNRRMERKIAFIAEHYQQWLPVFCAKLDVMIQEQKINQQIGAQGRIKYLGFLRLFSSEATESYEIALVMSSSFFYLDRQASFGYWNPEGLYHGVNEELMELEKKLKKDFQQLQQEERLFLKHLLVKDNWKAFQTIIEKMVIKITDHILTSGLMLEPKVQVVSGNYMDKVTFVCGIKTE